MTWTVAGFPNFVADDAAAMLGEIVTLQIEAMRQGVTDPESYAEAYALAFSGISLLDFVYRPPAVVANGVTTLIRRIGLFALLDDGLALAFLAMQSAWETTRPAVQVARVVGGVPVYTRTRRRQLDNRIALHALVHRAAALAFAERLPSVNMGDLPRSFEARTVTTSMFNRVIAEAATLNDGTMRTLRVILAQCWTLIDNRAPAAADGELVLAGITPSLVAAHYAYRDARQVQRIRDANPTAHPNFMARELLVPPWP